MSKKLYNNTRRKVLICWVISRYSITRSVITKLLYENLTSAFLFSFIL